MVVTGWGLYVKKSRFDHRRSLGLDVNGADQFCRPLAVQSIQDVLHSKGGARRAHSPSSPLSVQDFETKQTQKIHPTKSEMIYNHPGTVHKLGLCLTGIRIRRSCMAPDHPHPGY